MKEHAVLALGGNVKEANVLYLTAAGILVPVKGGDGDGLCRAPPVRAKAPGLYDNIGIAYILYRAAVPNLNGQSPVAAGDHAVLYQHIAKIAHSLGADLNGSGGGYQGAAVNDDIFAGAVLGVALAGLKANAVVGALHMAAQNAHIGAVVRVNAVAVGHIQIIENANTVNKHIVAPGRCRVQNGASTMVMSLKVIWLDFST